MEEIQSIRIKSLYGEIKGYLISLPKQFNGPYIVPAEICRNYNTAVLELTQISRTDYERFNVPNIEERGGSDLNIRLVQPKMSALVNRLEEEYGFGSNHQVSTTPGIVIFNKNQNEVSLQINYTINDLIEQSSDDESRNKLKELRDELDKTDKNWKKIRSIIIWVINFSRELFIKIIPIILEKRI